MSLIAALGAIATGLVVQAAPPPGSPALPKGTTSTARSSGLSASDPGADYNRDVDRWNGIGYFLQTAAEARVDVDVVDTLDLALLEPDDAVMLLYPTVALPTEELLAFVEAGGNLIVADDAGTSAPLLGTLGIARTTEPPHAHKRFAEDQDSFPIVRVAGQHFLFFHVDEVVANHPAILGLEGRSGATPILSFDDGREHLVVEARQGQGAVLAIADPSLFLNEMLRRFYGNKQFAANVLRYYCLREPCKLRLVMPGAGFSHHFDRQRARLGDLPRNLGDAIEAINAALADASADLAEPPYAGVAPLIPVAASIVVLAAIVAFVRRRTRAPTLSAFVGPPEPYAGGPRREPRLRRPGASLAPSVEDALGLVVQREHADFVGLALTLADHASDLLKAEALQASKGRSTPSGAASAPSEASINDTLVRVQAETAGLRSRQPPHVTADRFLRFYDDVQVLARHLRARTRGRA